MNRSEPIVASKLTANPAAIPEKSLILLTGASGYIGGRLVPSLENHGYRLRCVARRPEFLQAEGRSINGSRGG